MLLHNLKVMCAFITVHSLQTTAAEQGQKFIEQLARTSEKLLLQFDNMLTVDDIIKGSKCKLSVVTCDCQLQVNKNQNLT